MECLLSEGRGPGFLAPTLKTIVKKKWRRVKRVALVRWLTGRGVYHQTDDPGTHIVEEEN